MNELKLSMIKFLMTTFESSFQNINGVLYFKKSVNDLERRGQIPIEVKEFIFSLYGITNTDVFKPSIQNNKLMQINMLMSMYENSFSDNKEKEFVKYVSEGVSAGSILKSARDAVFFIYDLDKSNKNTNLKMNNQNTVDRTTKSTLENLRQPKNPTINQSTEVKKDMALFKSEFVASIYYRYLNSNYDGCSGSSRYSHTQIIKAINKPLNADLVYFFEGSADACHHDSGYREIPKNFYKEKPVSKVTISDGCSSSGFSSRGC